LKVRGTGKKRKKSMAKRGELYRWYEKVVTKMYKETTLWKREKEGNKLH